MLDEGAVPPAALRAIRSVKKNDGKAKAREAKAHQVNIARAREKLQAKKMRARAKLTVVKAAHKKILRAKVRAIKKVKRAVAKQVAKPDPAELKDFTLVYQADDKTLTAKRVKGAPRDEHNMHFNLYTDQVLDVKKYQEKRAKRGKAERLAKAKEKKEKAEKAKKRMNTKLKKREKREVEEEEERPESNCDKCHGMCKTGACKEWCKLKWCAEQDEAPIDDEKPMASQGKRGEPENVAKRRECEVCNGPVGGEQWCQEHCSEFM